jgi:hypothetical protein
LTTDRSESPAASPRERWLALTQEEQDAENVRRKERGEKAIPTHREWPKVEVHDPIVVHLTPTTIQPVGECLCCGHVLPLAVWKDAPLSDVMGERQGAAQGSRRVRALRVSPRD